MQVRMKGLVRVRKKTDLARGGGGGQSANGCQSSSSPCCGGRLPQPVKANR